MTSLGEARWLLTEDNRSASCGAVNCADTYLATYREYEIHFAISLIVGRLPYMSSPTR
jgi:hypothetical protein